MTYYTHLSINLKMYTSKWVLDVHDDVNNKMLPVWRYLKPTSQSMTIQYLQIWYKQMFVTSYLCGQKSWDLDGSISGPSHANFCVYIWWPVNCGKKRCVALNIHDMWQGIFLHLVHTPPGLIACQHVISLSIHGEHLPPWYFFEPSLQSREKGQGGPIVYG